MLEFNASQYPQACPHERIREIGPELFFAPGQYPHEAADAFQPQYGICFQWPFRRDFKISKRRKGYIK
jgi:hypothetical protein